MTSSTVSLEDSKVVNLQERRLDRTVLRTYQSRANVEEIVPNENQPRFGSTDDEEFQRQIESNGGLSEPLLVEPHPSQSNRFRIIDGDRRWANSRVLVNQGKSQFRQLPIEVTDRTLSDEERLRVWVYIHKQRKEWESREKEMVAYRLVDMVGRASAANILGVTVRELDKWVEVFELSGKFVSMRDPGGAITWARELLGLSKKLLTPSVVDAVVKKVNQKRITNSKDLRKLRIILRDPVAKSNFLSIDGDVDSAMLRVAPPEPQSRVGLVGEIEAATVAMRRAPWTTIEQLRGNVEVLRLLDEAELLVKNLRKTLST